MKKIGILVDSGINISKDEAKKLGWEFICLSIMDEEGNIYEDDGSEELRKKITQILQTSFLKTSQLNQEKLKLEYEKLLKKYDEIYFFPISKNLSGMYESSVLAARKVSDKIHVIDLPIASIPGLTILKELADSIKSGDHTPEEVQSLIEEKAKDRVAIIIPANLKYLHRSGRINTSKMLLTSTLRILPILKYENGEFSPTGKSRNPIMGSITAIKRIIDERNITNYEIMFGTSYDDPEKESKFEEAIYNEEAFKGKNISSCKLAPVITSHLGPEIYFILIIKK